MKKTKIARPKPKRYYPEFFDPADIDEPYSDPKKGTLWDGFINDDDSEIDHIFAFFLWEKIQNASNEIDDLYEEQLNGEIRKKPYLEVRRIFESNFKYLERICLNEVFHNPPFMIDTLLWELNEEKKISLLYCYGLYCIDRGLRSYFLKHTEMSTQTISYGVSAIEAATAMKLLVAQQSIIVKNISSKAGKARAAKYQPLKDLAKTLVVTRKYPSRRNAAISIESEIREAGLRLIPEVRLSKYQAVQTITGWLKEMGLPADVSLQPD